MVEGFEKETDALRRGVEYAHERLHHRIGNDGRKTGRTIIYQMATWKLLVKILLQLSRHSLQEHQTTHGIFFYSPNATGIFAALIDYTSMNEVIHAIIFQLFRKSTDLGVVNKNITP